MLGMIIDTFTLFFFWKKKIYSLYLHINPHTPMWLSMEWNINLHLMHTPLSETCIPPYDSFTNIALPSINKLIDKEGSVHCQTNHI